MQISATEVARLVTAKGTELPRRGSAEIEFVEITPDSLPKTVEPEASELERVMKMVASAPDVRTDIVMKLKERIDNGEYKVSGEDIADMMVRRMKADSIR